MSLKLPTGGFLCVLFFFDTTDRGGFVHVFGGFSILPTGGFFVALSLNCLQPTDLSDCINWLKISRTRHEISDRPRGQSKAPKKAMRMQINMRWSGPWEHRFDEQIIVHEEKKTLTKNLPPSHHGQLVSSSTRIGAHYSAFECGVASYGGERRHLILGQAVTTARHKESKSAIFFSDIAVEFPVLVGRSNHAQTQMLRSLGTSFLNGIPPPAGSRIMCGSGFVWSFGHIFTIVVPSLLSSARPLCRSSPAPLPAVFFLLLRGMQASISLISVCHPSVPAQPHARASHLTIGSLDRRDVLLVVICHGTAPTPLRCHKWNMQRISSLLGPHDIDLPLIRPQLCPQPIIAFPRIVDQ